MKRPYKIVISLMAMPALAAGVSACSASGGGQQPGISSANSIITAYTTEPQTRLTPGTTNENGGYRVLTMLYSRLVSFDPQGKAHNEVAQSIRAEKNNRRYTIKLKKGWKFSDGTPVTASSFTRSWSYTANSANGQLTSSFFSIIKGYGDLQKKGISAHAQLSGLKVVDKTTFTVDLTQPSQAFPVMVGYTAFSPLPQSFFANPREFGEHPVGNGPYKFKSWTHNKQIEIIKNPYYKGNFTVKNGGITFKIYTDPSSAYSDVEAGNLDVMDTVPASALRTFQTDTTIKAYNKAGATTFGLRFAAGLKHFSTTTEGHQFSGGMRQRVLIAMALAQRPALLIADEPTSALGVTVQKKILDNLQSLTRSLGTSVLFITHDLGLAAQRADQIAVMHQGEIVEFGPGPDVVHHPQHPYTQKLIHAAPSLSSQRIRSGKPRRLPNERDTPLLQVRGLSKKFSLPGSAGNFQAVPCVSPLS